MSRLPRPHIPFPVRIEVALGQVGMREDAIPVFTATFPTKSKLLDVLLRMLRAKLEIDPKAKLDLDHDPPLAAREKIMRNGKVVGYIPDANDPNYLVYRTADDHKLKTNIRGEHGQHPDRVLIKRQRRRERCDHRPAFMRHGPRKLKRLMKARQKQKRRWPSRPLRSASRWPKRKEPRR